MNLCYMMKRIGGHFVRDHRCHFSELQPIGFDLVDSFIQGHPGKVRHNVVNRAPPCADQQIGTISPVNGFAAGRFLGNDVVFANQVTMSV